ncbi:MAG: esterase-like activity of phytase family protein [Pseudanabaenales cyanobacterium]|nr:esterase-like activity of phytase family protein [Pseudanabaenales cyanobacterium]
MKGVLIGSSLIVSTMLGASLYRVMAQECPGMTSYMLNESGQCVDLERLEQSNFGDRENDGSKGSNGAFQRVASFPVFLNLEVDAETETDVDVETVAEIVAVSSDGETLVYTDSETENLGFVDIRDPANPRAMGLVGLGGEPTSVAVKGQFALAAVNTSPSFTEPSGKLVVVNIQTKTIVAEFALGGQPDSIAISPDQRFAAIAIENKRDEDLGDGAPPQAPGGFLISLNLSGSPSNWTPQSINLTGIADKFPNDPEPEYVDINQDNVAVVTLQENNHIVLVDLPTGRILNDWSADKVDLDQIDTIENDFIELNESLSDILREPDGVTWINSNALATADEGDLDGGSRGFTIFNQNGQVLFTPGNQVEHEVVRVGHYPEDRSENKGNEPENVDFGRYGKDDFLFVGSERSNVILVYNLTSDRQPELSQVLPAGVGPEGLLAIPERDLLVAASEIDNREDKIRSVINIYQRTDESPSYPTIVSNNRPDGLPIPWGALSDLASDPGHPNTLYTVYDSFYQKSRIFTLDTRQQPAAIINEIILQDTQGQLAAVDASLVNADKTVNLDPEGLTVRQAGGFWLASEGAGTVGDPDRPVETLNLLLQVNPQGVIEAVVTLPDNVNAQQVRFGFEGVASVGSGPDEAVYVAFQREWADDPDNLVRIGRYQTSTGNWSFFYYPIETPTSPNGGWVGLSALTHLGGDEFAVIERDNQGGPDARIKRIYQFSIAGLTPTQKPSSFPVVSKQLVRDLIPDLQATGGLVLERIESLTVLPDGAAWIVNDNDGVDDNNGETQLLRLPNLF